jgi:DNA-directed RNA polymerase subunit RPC12/RpoP
MKTITKNWELNYKCIDGCGTGIYNSTKDYKKCPECGGKMKQIHPLNSRDKKRK